MTGKRATHEIGWRGLLFPLLLGVPMAIGIGALAATFNEGPTLVTTVAFTLATMPASVGIWMIVFRPPSTPEYHEDTVEHRWMSRATSGAFLDLVTGLGVLLTVISVFDLEIGSQLVLVVLLLAAGADVFTRYAVLRRREV